MRRDESAELVEKQALSSDAHLLHFRSESLFESFEPGQFTMVRLPEVSDVLLRRPYSFCDADGEGRFSLLVKEAGRGTRALARLPPGNQCFVPRPPGLCLHSTAARAHAGHRRGGSRYRALRRFFESAPSLRAPWSRSTRRQESM